MPPTPPRHRRRRAENGGDRVLGAGVDDVIGAQFGGHREFAVHDVNANGKTACDPGIG